jgi:altronate dehydratase
VYYCSEFCETELVIYPFVPKLDNDVFMLGWPEPSTTDGIKVRTKTGAPLQVYRVQGGAVSNRGHLYISSDVKMSQGGGIRLIEMASGTIQDFQLNMKAEYRSNGDGCEKGEFEYQGLCIKDLDQVPHHPNVAGQLHFGLLNNDTANEDNVTLAHFSITDPDEKPWI